MIVPSGKGLPARYASIALSLPITTRMSLSSPASWAAEMNFQSRYPGGIVVTMICLPVLSCPKDEGVIHATTPVAVRTATNENPIRFMVPSLDACEHSPGIRTRDTTPWRPVWAPGAPILLTPAGPCQQTAANIVAEFQAIQVSGLVPSRPVGEFGPSRVGSTPSVKIAGCTAHLMSESGRSRD